MFGACVTQCSERSAPIPGHTRPSNPKECQRNSSAPPRFEQSKITLQSYYSHTFSCSRYGDGNNNRKRRGVGWWLSVLYCAIKFNLLTGLLSHRRSTFEVEFVSRQGHCGTGTSHLPLPKHLHYKTELTPLLSNQVSWPHPLHESLVFTHTQLPLLRSLYTMSDNINLNIFK